MSDDKRARVEAAVDEAVQFAEEIEAGVETSTEGARLERIRALLHAWVDTVDAAVVNNASGQVTLVHGDGVRSSITSKNLHFILSAPVR